MSDVKEICPKISVSGKYYYNIKGIRIRDNQLLSTIKRTDSLVRISIPSSRFLANESHCLIGEYGARKIFIKLSDSVGLRIYCQLNECFDTSLSGRSFHTKKEARLDYDLSHFLFIRGLHPKPQLCSVSLNISFVNYYNKDEHRISGDFWGLKCNIVQYPVPSLDFRLSRDRGYYRQLINNRKVCILDFPIEEIFEKSIIDNNPKFTRKYYIKFKKKIRKIFNNDLRFRKLRHKNKSKPDTKYTNVLYCCKNKKWYWIDFD